MHKRIIAAEAKVQKSEQQRDAVIQSVQMSCAHKTLVTATSTISEIKLTVCEDCGLTERSRSRSTLPGLVLTSRAYPVTTREALELSKGNGVDCEKHRGDFIGGKITLEDIIKGKA